METYRGSKRRQGNGGRRFLAIFQREDVISQLEFREVAGRGVGPLGGGQLGLGPQAALIGAGMRRQLVPAAQRVSETQACVLQRSGGLFSKD